MLVIGQKGGMRCKRHWAAAAAAAAAAVV